MNDDYILYGLIGIMILTLVSVIMNIILLGTLNKALDKNTGIKDLAVQIKDIKKINIPTIIISILTLISHGLLLYFSFKATWRNNKKISKDEIIVIIFTLIIFILFITNIVKYIQTKEKDLL